MVIGICAANNRFQQDFRGVSSDIETVYPVLQTVSDNWKNENIMST